MNAYEQLCKPLQGWLVDRGWRNLRPIQERSFVSITKGNNVLLVAPTAGGKTEAAFLPLLNRHYQNARRGIKIVYVAPLKALINDMEKRLEETGLCRSVYLEPFKWHGDVDRSKKISVIRKLPDILLTTPESLDVILYSSYVDKSTLFEPLDTVIIDETHYFAGNVRGAQLASILQRLNVTLKRDIQRVCLSATVGNPLEVLSWMSFPSERKQEVVHVIQEDLARESRLLYFCGNHEEECEKLTKGIVKASLNENKTIIFENSRKNAEKRSVDFVGKSCICHVHHGSVDRWLRQTAEFDLAYARSATTVIATCTLELGIDIGDLDLIQNEGPFPSVSSYVQRIGRTGRIAPPQKCNAYAVEEFEFLNNLAIMSLADEGFIEENDLPENYYQVLLQQILMMTLSESGISERRMKSLLASCAAFRAISERDLQVLFEFWLANGVLRKNDGFILVGPKIEQKYGGINYRDLFVLFDTPRSYEVWNKRIHIGTLDSYFLRSRKEKFVFILAGRWWKTERIDHKEGVVYVEPVHDAPPPASWLSRGARDVSYQVAQRIKAILLSQQPYDEYIEQDEAKEFLSCLRADSLSRGLSDSLYDLLGQDRKRCELITYAGSKVNFLIALLIAKLNHWLIDKVDYDSMVFSATKNEIEVSTNKLEEALHEIFRRGLIKDRQLPPQLLSGLDRPKESKWLEWLPVLEIGKLVFPNYFDINMADEWINKVHKNAAINACR